MPAPIMEHADTCHCASCGWLPACPARFRSHPSSSTGASHSASEVFRGFPLASRVPRFRAHARISHSLQSDEMPSTGHLDAPFGSSRCSPHLTPPQLHVATIAHGKTSETSRTARNAYHHVVKCPWGTQVSLVIGGKMFALSCSIQVLNHGVRTLVLPRRPLSISFWLPFLIRLVLFLC